MRGKFDDQGALFSYISPEKRVPENHPLREIRELVRDVLNPMVHGVAKPVNAVNEVWLFLEMWQRSNRTAFACRNNGIGEGRVPGSTFGPGFIRRF